MFTKSTSPLLTAVPLILFLAAQFARKFYIAQWFRDTTTEAEKSMRVKNPKDEDSSDDKHHTKEVETTGEIMQRAEKRKKFLRNIIKTSPAQFATLKYEHLKRALACPQRCRMPCAACQFGTR